MGLIEVSLGLRWPLVTPTGMCSVASFSASTSLEPLGWETWGETLAVSPSTIRARNWTAGDCGGGGGAGVVGGLPWRSEGHEG